MLMHWHFAAWALCCIGHPQHRLCFDTLVHFDVTLCCSVHLGSLKNLIAAWWCRHQVETLPEMSSSSSSSSWSSSSSDRSASQTGLNLPSQLGQKKFGPLTLIFSSPFLTLQELKGSQWSSFIIIIIIMVIIIIRQVSLPDRS